MSCLVGKSLYISFWTGNRIDDVVWFFGGIVYDKTSTKYSDGR